MQKNGLNSFIFIFLKFNSKRSQILKLPNQNTDRQMVQKVTQMAINWQIWQHCKRNNAGRFQHLIFIDTCWSRYSKFNVMTSSNSWRHQNLWYWKVLNRKTVFSGAVCAENHDYAKNLASHCVCKFKWKYSTMFPSLVWFGSKNKIE